MCSKFLPHTAMLQLLYLLQHKKLQFSIHAQINSSQTSLNVDSDFSLETSDR